jgi:methyl-accepting chemotaxis protein
MVKNRYRTWFRRTYLLSAFQCRFALTFSLLGAGAVFLALFLIYRLVQRSGGAEALVGLLWADSKTDWLVGAALVFVSFLAGLFSLGILMLHRIAGPVHVISSYMSELAQGRHPVIRPLRSKDELVDFYNTFKQMAERLRQHELEEVVEIREALETLTRIPRSTKADAPIGILTAILERKLSSLQGSGSRPDNGVSAVAGPLANGGSDGEVALTKRAEE